MHERRLLKRVEGSFGGDRSFRRHDRVAAEFEELDRMEELPFTVNFGVDAKAVFDFLGMHIHANGIQCPREFVPLNADTNGLQIMLLPGALRVQRLAEKDHWSFLVRPDGGVTHEPDVAAMSKIGLIGHSLKDLLGRVFVGKKLPQ